MDSLGYFEPTAETTRGPDIAARVPRRDRLATDHPTRLAYNEARREVSHAGGRVYRLLKILHRAHARLTCNPAAYGRLLAERRVEPHHRSQGAASAYLPTIRLLLGATKSDQTKLRYARALALADREGAADAAAFVRSLGGVSAAAKAWRDGEGGSGRVDRQTVIDCVAELVDEQPEIGGRVEGAAPANAPRGLVLMLGHVDGRGQAKVLQVLPEGRAVLRRILARRLEGACGSQALVAAAAEAREVTDEQMPLGLPLAIGQAAQVLALLGLVGWASNVDAADDPSWTDPSANFDWRTLATIDPPPPVVPPAPPAPAAEAVDLAGQPTRDLNDDLFSFDY